MIQFTSRRCVLTAVALAFVAAAIEIPVHPLAAQTPAAGTRKKKAEELPSQEAVLAESTVAKLNVAYGDDEKQRLDVYSPKGVKDAPVVVFFHRGEWTRGDKSEVSYKPKFLNENGIVFVAANYRLSPAVTHPAHICDAADAVCWVHDHAAEIGTSPQKIVILGHSAGCHLVTLLALDPRYLAGDGLRPTDLRGVVAWSGGAYDLVAKVKAGGTYAPYIRQAFGDSEATWRDASPVAHVGDAQPLPPFLFVSVEKGNSSHQATEHLAGLIRGAKGQADSRLLENRTHMTAIHLVGAPADATGAILLDFIRRVTR